MTYRVLAPAVLEMTLAAEYYDSQVAGLGADFLDELDAAIMRLLQFPEAWSLLGEPFLVVFPMQSFTRFQRPMRR